MEGNAVNHPKRRQVLVRLLLISFIACWPTNLGMAAEGATQLTSPAQSQGEPLELEPVVVTATRGERRSFDVPSAVTIIEGEEAARRSATVLPDLLRGEAGVFVQQTTPGQAAPIIRGLIGSSILMLVDGMRLNTAFFRSAPNQYFALVDPYNVDRLEVVRGAGSTLYGSDAMGGVLNVITPIPRFTTDQWQLHGRALEQFVSADTYWVSRLSLQGGRIGVAMSGGFTYQDHNDLRGGGDTGVQRSSGYDVYAGNGTLSLERSNQDLLFSFQYLQQPKTRGSTSWCPASAKLNPARLFSSLSRMTACLSTGGIA
jgi:outer membrane cobalamin receptor